MKAALRAKDTFYARAKNILINGPITFPKGKEVLIQTSSNPKLRAAFAREIFTFLKSCRGAATRAGPAANKDTTLSLRSSTATGRRSRAESAAIFV